MTDEVLLIVLGGSWPFVHVCVHGFAQWATAGNAWALGARDDPPRETPLNGRLRRACANYPETLPGVLTVLVAAELSGRANEPTSYGGWVRFCCRVLYLPAYASGIGGLRSIVWGASMCAIVAMTMGLVPGAP